MEEIYIRLIEGVELFVPVKASHIGADVFKIMSNESLDLEEDATNL